MATPSPILRIVQKLIELTRAQAYAQITITLRRGTIEVVHVSQTYKPDALPLDDPSLQHDLNVLAARATR